jgi:hypothetical protein
MVNKPTTTKIEIGIDSVYTTTTLKIIQIFSPYIILGYYYPSLSGVIYLKYLELIKIFVFLSYYIDVLFI